MQEVISKTEFKARALEYFRQVEAKGKTIIVTDKGRPTIQIRRYRHDERPPLERLKGSVVEYIDPLEPVGENEWEAQQ